MIRMAQFGTKHGHAAGKLAAMQKNPEVEVAGVFEPDAERRAELEKGSGPFRGAAWFDAAGDMLGDPSIAAVASEGSNEESLDQTEEMVRAGKHVWYDKPAGENWEQWQQVAAMARERNLVLQMGYMLRYHDGFERIAEWVRSGMLGAVFSIRAHMSTRIPPEVRRTLGRHRGGICYDLCGHMLDQIVWLLGRPEKVTSFLRNHSDLEPAIADNTLVVLEYDDSLAFVDIAAMESRPLARRFEAYGTGGSAIILEPFEPGAQVRLCLEEAGGGYDKGEQFIPLRGESRQQLYELELECFLASIQGQQRPLRPLEHELLVQETLLRATGVLTA